MSDDNNLPNRPTVRHSKQQIPPLYCDATNLSTNPFGIKMIFGSTLVSDDAQLEIEDHVTIGMSAEHAAAFHRVLGDHLRAFVQAAGEIRGFPEFNDGGTAHSEMLASKIESSR
ncbi:MAG: hypothetical protein O3A53_05385 [Acidobacteria bacterium]|nr:hypothetical protein [Acidobacteriota bacterium]MDA1234212.1 hypothetical protein [Acidobacteriota bacterium]